MKLNFGYHIVSHNEKCKSILRLSEKIDISSNEIIQEETVTVEKPSQLQVCFAYFPY